MSDTIHRGTISFVNYEKHFGTIEYNNKKKSVNFKTNDPDNNKKPHQFRINDEVSFQLKLSDRGDKMTAYKVKFLHNTSIDLLLQKAAIENRFSGYLKIVDDEYFVKEWDSYIFFPLIVSPWEKPPVESAANEAITFKFLNLDKPNGLTAELFSHNYLPEYKKAMQHFKNEISIDAVVYKVSPHGIYLNLFDEVMRAKLPLAEQPDAKEGDVIPVLITHLAHARVVVKKAANPEE
ncbi:MAG TPA: hypothetical protein VHM26_12265 [Chitinophagaceae bacterium]|jgi:hypothetical protein|nr:hypothetical protein [Chitinophagaceae bacterium]